MSFILANLIRAVAMILNYCIIAMYYLIIARALVSWVSADPGNPIVQFLVKVTEPVLEPIRRRIPFSLKFGIDISPIIAFLVLLFIQAFVVKSLSDISGHMAGRYIFIDR